MSDSFTLTLSGASSILDAHYFPPIELPRGKKCVLGLVEFLSYNSIPNVDESNNKLHFVGGETITIPTGSYEVESIERFIQQNTKKTISIKPNNNTLRSEIVCDADIDLRPRNSIGRLLGFTPQILEAHKKHESDEPVAIMKVNALRVDCNITGGAYINNQRGHTIHEFFPTVPSGFKIVEVPLTIIYLPITVEAISHLQLKVVDENGFLVDFRGEQITIRLHIKAL